MNAPRLLLPALILAIIAIVLQLAALGQHSHGAETIALASKLPEFERAKAKMVARDHITSGALIYRVGLAFALVSLGLAVRSERHHKSAARLGFWISTTRIATVAFLGFYAMLQFMLT